MAWHLMCLALAGAVLHLQAPCAAPQPAPAADARVTVALERDPVGNYVGNGWINEHAVRLLVDTGATMVVIPEGVAKRIGLKKGKPSTFHTAGGTVLHYATELDSLRIGPIQIKQVPAAINPQMKEDFALLGMSALAVLRFSQEGNRLLLSYDPANDTEPLAASAAPQPIRFRRSLRECMGEGKIIDRKALNCLHGN